MSLRITKNIEEANFITHNGSFHADEVFCTALFELLYGEVNLLRTRELDGAREDAIIFDVGKGELDHHQKGRNGQRDNGVEYAAFGLVWKKYGRELLKKYNVLNVEEVFEDIDKNIICGMDNFDNGVSELKSSNPILNISKFIEHMAPQYGYSDDEDEKFMGAVGLAKIVLNDEIKFSNSKSMSKLIVETAIENSSNGIMCLNERVNWEEVFFSSKNPIASDILYVIRPGKEKEFGYTINAVVTKLGEFENRLKFPLEWGGRSPEELQIMTGIKTLKFCHPACFICVTDTFEDAYKTADLSIEMQMGKKR